MTQLAVNKYNGVAKGELTIKDDRSEPSTATAAKLSIESATGNKVTFDFSKFNDLSKVNTVAVADSVADDVAGVVADLNLLLAALRTSKVLSV